MPSRPSLQSRPRLRPGVPLGGVAAVAVLAATVSWGLINGDPLVSSHKWPRSLDKIALALDSHGFNVQVDERLAERLKDKLAAKGRDGAIGDGNAVDMAGISNAVRARIDAAAKAATVKADRNSGRRDRDIQYLDRSTNPDGSNHLTAMVDAPSGVRLAGVMGTVRIKVVDDAADGVLFSLENSRKRYNLSIDDGLLWITGPGPDSQPAVTLDLAVPRGTPLLVNNFTGDLSVEGDLGAPARLELANGQMTLGALESVRVRITQSGTVSIGDVKDVAGVQLPASGEVRLGNVGSAAVEVIGQGRVRMGNINDGLALSLPGAGDVETGVMTGSLSAAIPGAGKVTIEGGTADRLAVGVTGAGTVAFNGVANNPRILMAGPGSVSLAGHQGTPKVYQVGPGKVELSH